MSETTHEPTAPEVPKPDAADRKPRAAKSPTTDPEAPYGWMKDPKTGETRPRKRPGKSLKSEPAPRTRPANKARSAAPGTTEKFNARKASADVGQLVQGTWLLLAAVPPADVKIPGTKISIRDVSVRTRAQAAILEDNAEGLVRGVTMMAEHSKPVAKFIAKAGDETGPAWILPAMMVLMPFVVQSASMWNAPLNGDVMKLAERTSGELDAMLHGMQSSEPTPEASPNSDNPNNGHTTVFGSEDHQNPAV